MNSLIIGVRFLTQIFFNREKLSMHIYHVKLTVLAQAKCDRSHWCITTYHG
jgi:hypothetical protein